MAFPTAVNDQITDSLTPMNARLFGDAPPTALGKFFMATALPVERMAEAPIGALLQALSTRVGHGSVQS